MKETRKQISDNLIDSGNIKQCLKNRIAELGQQISSIETSLSKAKKDNDGRKPTRDYLDWRDYNRDLLLEKKQERINLQEQLKNPTPVQELVPEAFETPALELLRQTYDYLKDERDVLAPDSTDEIGFDLFEAIEEFLGIPI